MSNEFHNPLSQEGESLHEKSKEEKAEDLGISPEEFDEKVLTLRAGDRETTDRMKGLIKEIKSHAYSSDDYNYFWPRLDEVANRLLIDGSLNIPEYLKYVSRDIFNKYGYDKSSIYGRVETDSAKKAIRIIRDVLKEQKEKAA